MIPREEGEGLLDYLDRLNILAAERAGIETQVHALLLRLREAESAETQLARYLAMIDEDQIASIRPANSEINAESNSEETDHGAQAQDHAAQAEIPSDTQEKVPAVDPTEPANSEINSETADEEVEFVSDFERTRIWAVARASVFTAIDAGNALDILEKSTAKYLSQLVALGYLIRVDGTGKPGVPSRYYGPAREQEAEEEAPYRLNRDRLSLDQRLLLEHLEKHGSMTQKLVCNQMNWSTSRADRAINELTRGGLLGRNSGLLVAIPAELVAAD